jgi:hypothetical protein
MTKRRKLVTGLGVGLMALALMAGVIFSTMTQSTANAAPAGQTTTPSTSTTPASSQDNDQYRAAFIKALAAQLGVDEAKLNSSYSAAVSEVVAQAVKDGKLTQAEADKIIAEAKNGFQGVPFFGQRGQHQGGPGGRGEMNGQAMDAAAATALGITADELKTELQAGKSIADVAKAKNVDVQKVKDAMLAAIKADLDAKVKAGTLTQAQADQHYQNATSQIDNIINHAGMGSGKGGRK